MANPMVKGWRYLMALFQSKLDEHADPQVQIQQAVEEAQRQHHALVQQAAAVIGSQRQLEMKLSRHLGEVERLQAMARQALMLADRARSDGDGAKAAEYERTAQSLATQLVAAEQSMEDLKSLHDQALTAAGQARRAVDNNAHLLQQKLAERTKLLTQLEQAKMQEAVARSLESMSALTAPGSTPSLDEVREKIERRYAGAVGRVELAGGPVQGQMLEIQRSAIDLAGATRLEEIRAALGSTAGTPAIGGAAATPAVGAAPTATGAAAPSPAAQATGPESDPGRSAAHPPASGDTPPAPGGEPGRDPSVTRGQQPAAG